MKEGGVGGWCETNDVAERGRGCSTESCTLKAPIAKKGYLSKKTIKFWCEPQEKTNVFFAFFKFNYKIKFPRNQLDLLISYLFIYLILHDADNGDI